MLWSDEKEKQWYYWYPRVYGYFYRRLDNKFEVEELTAGTMNTVFSAKNILNFEAYLWRVAHNYLVRYINTKNMELMTVPLEDYDVAAFVPDQEVEMQVSDHYQAKIQQLMSCVHNQLPNSEDLQIISLCIQDEKNSSQVGEILNIKPNTVRQRLSRALKKVRERCKDLWRELNSN